MYFIPNIKFLHIVYEIEFLYNKLSAGISYFFPFFVKFCKLFPFIPSNRRKKHIPVSPTVPSLLKKMENSYEQRQAFQSRFIQFQAAHSAGKLMRPLQPLLMLFCSVSSKKPHIYFLLRTGDENPTPMCGHTQKNAIGNFFIGKKRMDIFYRNITRDLFFCCCHFFSYTKFQ